MGTSVHHLGELPPGCSMGPDFHDGQKTTKKNLPLKWQKKTKNILNLSQTHKKITKRGFSNTVSKKYLDTTVAKKKRKNV